MKKLVSIVVPTFNEEDNIPILYNAIRVVMSSLPYEYELIFVDDGSSDRSLSVLDELAQTAQERVFYLSFSRNFGHQSAVKAGYAYAKGDCVITMDCDMQHPPVLLPELLKLWDEGFEVVYTKRMQDKRLSWFKQATSKAFYRVMNVLSDVRLEEGAADFRLLDRKVVQVLNQMDESDPFIRGLVKWVGFKQIGIDYMPDQRASGTSKYTVKKMILLATRGITSFSVKPLYAAIWIGMSIAFLCVLYLPYVIYSVVTDHVMAGWSSLLLTVAFLGSLQLVILGIIGVYIGHLCIQTKHRPEYIVRKTNIEKEDEKK